jgi:uncharacterized protein
VILVDANILIYAHIDDFPQHPRAKSWLDQQLNGPARVGLPWGSLLAFLRVCTNPRLFPRTDSTSEAWKQVLEWLACDPVWIPEATDRHAQVLGRLIGATSIYANLVPDAHLAALAIEHGLTLCSSDGDFARFSGLRWMNPLA